MSEKYFFLLKDTSIKDLSTLAKAAFELLRWRVIWEPHLEKAVSMILSSANDSNWRIRSATLTYLRTFMYRLVFNRNLKHWNALVFPVCDFIWDVNIQMIFFAEFVGQYSFPHPHILTCQFTRMHYVNMICYLRSMSGIRSFFQVWRNKKSGEPWRSYL